MTHNFCSTEVYCGPVPQIDNGFSIGATNVTYMGQATYQCYAGFGFPSGGETITCTSEGKWERLPECKGNFTIIEQLVCNHFL